MVLIGALVGCKVGFFKSIAKPIKIIAAISLTVCLAAPIIDAWTRPFFVEKAYGWIFGAIMEKCPELTQETAATGLSPFLMLLAKIFSVDVSGAASEAEGAEEIIGAVSSAIAAPVGNLIAVVVTYIALFILMLIFLGILISLLDKCLNSGPLEVVNRILGFVLGIVVASVIACTVANIIGRFTAGVPGGFVYNFFKGINPFEVVVKITNSVKK
jgi:uncharacterized membrane protein required for colicin V production